MTDISNKTPMLPNDDEPEEVVVDMVDSVGRGRVPEVCVVDMVARPARPLEPTFLELDEAREYLRRNELDQALAVAKELTQLYPALPAARTIMARCFINRKEYRKALAILNAIADADKTADAYYYLGLCRSRLRDIPKAVAMLEKSVELAENDAARKPARDLLAHLRGGSMACPECGLQSRYDAMVDIGDMTVCPACARKLLDEPEPAASAPAEPAVSRRGRRRGRSIAGIIGRRAVTLLLLLFLVYLGMCAASVYVPRQYENLRARLPADWTFLPKTTRSANSIAESSEHGDSTQPRTLLIDSPLIEYAVAGQPLSHQLTVDGMPGREGRYDALFSPQPKGRYRFDGKTGEFTWIPADEDAGKRFDVTFGATFRTARAREQINRIRVYSQPDFRAVHTRTDAVPGEVAHLLAADVTGDGAPEIIAVRGGAWNGLVTVFQATIDGYFHPFARLALDGRPAGAGMVEVNGETWLSVADYWNGTLRHFAVRDGNLAELPLAVRLPGKPVAAASDKASGATVVLCRHASGLRLAWYRAVDADYIEKDREWSLPGGHVWRKLLMLPESPMAGLRPRALLVGGDIEKSLFVASLDKGELTHVKIPAAGKIIDAALGKNGAVAVLTAGDNGYELLRFTLNAQGMPLNFSQTRLGDHPFLNGMVGVNAFGSRDGDDIALLSAGRLGLVFSGGVAGWDLPSPSSLMGRPAVLANGRDEPERVVFQADDGSLWSVGLNYGGEK